MRALWLAGVMSGLMVTGLQAAEPPDDLLLAPHSQANIMLSEERSGVEHAVVIGNVRRINNELRIEREVRSEGDLIRFTQELPAGHSARELFMQAKASLQEEPHSVLYFCEGRECGSSSIWANQVLNFARLYGPEAGQYYAALRLDTEPQRFVSLYAITRGNRRVYLHTEQFTPTEPVMEALLPTPATLIKQIDAEGYIAVPAFDLQDEDNNLRTDWLDHLNRMLRTDRTLRVEIRGEQGQAFVDGLIERGIRPERLQMGDQEPADQVIIHKI
ncbi:MAG: DUF4892 domain-containing protein [Pseudomonadaceae bacterium]|nr:MAG: DUF4892 domain-containing protein [Pseudomonadaceae bacterium]